MKRRRELEKNEWPKVEKDEGKSNRKSGEESHERAMKLCVQADTIDRTDVKRRIVLNKYEMVKCVFHFF